MDNMYELAAGAMGGTAMAGMLARAFISRSMKDLESAINRIGEIKSELATIAVRLEDVSKTNQLVRDIDRRMIAIETKIYNNGITTVPYKKR